MPIYTTDRKTETLSQLEKEIEELEGMAVEGEKPTQPLGEEEGESSPEDLKRIAEERAKLELKEPEQDLEFWKSRALKAEGERDIATNRFNVSKPKYDSNIYKLKQDNLALKKVRTSLYQELNKLKQTTQAGKEDPVDTLFNKETVDVLGEETANAIKKSIKDTNARVDSQEARHQADKLKRQKADLKAEEMIDYQSFIARLNKIVPDQGVLNRDSRFTDYLKAPDPMTGEIRWSLLRNAESRGDVGRVAGFFLDYKNTLEKPKTEPTDSINKRIAPSKGAGPDSVGDMKVKGFTGIEVDKIFDDVSRGKYKGRETEKIAILAQIDEAYMAGAITY